MKRKARFLLMAATAVTLAACSGDDHESGAPTDTEGNLIAARFSAGIGEAVPVRASGTTWAVNDKIGISATDNTTMATKYQNVEYTVSSDGTLTGETIYFQNMDEVTFTAYYPYTATSDMTDGVISGSTAAGNQTSTTQPTIDYLFASETTTYAKPTIELQFGHRMSKIVVKFEKGNGVEQSEVDGITQYTISGLKLAGTFDTATGTAAATGSASALTITKGTEDDAELQTSLIVYPQEVSGFTLSLSMGGNDYQCSLTVTDGKLEAGNSYTYKITVNKTGLTAAATISGWNSEDKTPMEGTAELLYGINTTTHTITTYKAGVITADMITKAMGNGKELNVVGVINNADLTTIVNKKKSYTKLNMSEAKGTDLELEDGAFADCTNLTSITLPMSLTEIGLSAFHDCKALTSITLPTSLTTIGENAFADCTNLKSITLPTSLTTIDSNAFYYCTSLESITLPMSLTEIGQSAFYYCEALKSITLPTSLTEIGQSAFYGCTSLESITLPTSLTTIGTSAFDGCTDLTSITFQENFSGTIGDNTFKDCTDLTSITFPESFSGTIGSGAFQGCSSVMTVTCYAKKAPTCDSTAFSDITDGCILYVPSGCINAYKEAEGWSYFENNGGIEEMQ